MNKAFYEERLDNLTVTLDLKECPSDMNDGDHQKLVERLAIFYQNMIKDQKEVKTVWQPAGEWKNYNEEKGFFYDTLLNNDISGASNYLLNFWRNRLGLIVKEYAKFEDISENKQPVTDAFLHSIGRNFLIWQDMYQKEAEDLKIFKNIGNPWGCQINGTLVTPKAIRFHSNMMHIKNLLSQCNGKRVGEIGGGYGGLAAYMLHHIEGVKYVDFDLPETLTLAAYHLLMNFPNKKIFLYGEEKFASNKVDDYDVHLLPNYLIEEFPSSSVDVFFNSFSLSEMPPETIQAYLGEIHRLSLHFFLHNNMDRIGVINRGFERTPASQFPIDSNKFTLIAKNYDLFHSHFGDYKEFLYALKIL